MKKFDPPQPVKLVCGILYSDERWSSQSLEDLRIQYGETDYRSAVLDFKYTDYYFKQMGQPLFRIFVSFVNLIDPSDLSAVKVFTNGLEEQYQEAAGGRRMINIDPGYLNPTAFILATSKNYSHRIYLGKGVFAQQELLFERKRTVTLDWTYPDYRSYEYQQILRKIRELYLQQCRSAWRGPGDSH